MLSVSIKCCCLNNDRHERCLLYIDRLWSRDMPTHYVELFLLSRSDDALADATKWHQSSSDAENPKTEVQMAGSASRSRPSALRLLGPRRLGFLALWAATQEIGWQRELQHGLAHSAGYIVLNIRGHALVAAPFPQHRSVDWSYRQSFFHGFDVVDRATERASGLQYIPLQHSGNVLMFKTFVGPVLNHSGSGALCWWNKNRMCIVSINLWNYIACIYSPAEAGRP